VVITEDGTGRKFPIADYSLTPDIAIVDPDFVMSMPPALTAHTGLDALTHALESHVSVMATPYTTGLSSKAIQAVFQFLPTAYNEPDNEEARHRLHDASTMAGMAFANAFLGICHSMAHTLGSTFKISHGLANAVMLSHVIAFNTTEAPAKQATFPQYRFYQAMEQYAIMTDRLRLDPDNKLQHPVQKVQCLIDAIEKLKAEVGVPAAIKELVPNEAEYLAAIPAMAETAFDDQCTSANPRYPLMHELAAMFKAAYYGPPARLVVPGTKAAPANSK
jgi:acetaldehyde dehydrogenase/alcohol dehydrogenase